MSHSLSVSWGSGEDCKRIKTENWVLTGPGESTWQAWGVHIAKSRMQQRPGRNRGTCLYWGPDGVLWGSWPKPRLINSDHKRGFSKLCGVCKGKTLGDKGDFVTRAFGEVILETYIYLWLCRLSSRTHSYMKGWY